MKSVAFLVAAITLSFCAELHAQQALRCDGDLAMPRDSKAVVVWKCGEPFFVQSFCRLFDPNEGVVTLLPIGPYAPGHASRAVVSARGRVVLQPRTRAAHCDHAVRARGVEVDPVRRSGSVRDAAVS